MLHPPASARTVLISGLGLMGGSLAAAATAAGWRVLLHHHRPTVAQEAEARGWGTAIAEIPAAASADLAVVCTPVATIARVVREVAATTGTIITDVGSTKGGLCAELGDLAQRFIGSHPMCGSHLQGLVHADAGLYRGKAVIVTPVAATPAPALALVEELWRSVGSRVLRLAPADHDRAVAEASHLPHALASLAAAHLSAEAAPVAASGFRDATRIAGASPELWRDILLANREAMLPLLAHSRTRLLELERLLADGDGDGVAAWLGDGHRGRARFDRAQDPG